MGKMRLQRRYNGSLIFLKYWVCLCILCFMKMKNVSCVKDDGTTSLGKSVEDGDWHFRRGDELRLVSATSSNDNNKRAAHHYWKSILLYKGSSSSTSYTVEMAFSKFMSCFSRPTEGFLIVARESALRGQCDMSQVYVSQILQSTDKTFEEEEECHILQKHCSTSTSTGVVLSQQLEEMKQRHQSSAEVWYNQGTTHFNAKRHEQAAIAFDQACSLGAPSNYIYNTACVNAIYCRSHLANWTTYTQDMALLQQIVKSDILQSQFPSIHPHMMLGFLMDDLPLPYKAQSNTLSTQHEFAVLRAEHPSIQSPYTTHFHPSSSNTKLKVGFVGAGFNSKAVLYLSQDIFRFYDTDKIEMHIFSVGPPDHPQFIQYTMRGVDWRTRVKQNVDYFHDVQHLNVPQLAKFIHDDQQIHILIDWDGFARQGERAGGLFSLKPAPIQILHQEFLGTSGNPLMDYVISDLRVTPPELQSGFVEKIIYMPHHFFAKGHAMHPDDMSPPSLTYNNNNQSPNSKNEYRLGFGTPQYNKCTMPSSQRQVDFVFCNFHKFLKLNPITMDAWLDILQQVPNSILCLLENPKEAVPNVKKYIKSKYGKDMVDRVLFASWQKNPFDFQTYSKDLCNVVLDTHPYNGHTTAQDAMYGGVPMITRSDGKDMASRVTTSANILIGLDQYLNAPSIQNYVTKAVTLAKNSTLLEEVRSKLIESALKKNPMHPYWDMLRYVRNLEKGWFEAWKTYVDGKPKSHIYIKDDGQGSYEEDVRHSDQIKNRLHQQRQSSSL